MQRHLSKRDFETVAALSPLLSRVQDVQRRCVSIEGEIAEIEYAIKALKAGSTSENTGGVMPKLVPEFAREGDAERARLQTLKITIDWKANKRNHGTEEICENTAAASMVQFISRLIEEFGSDALEKMEKIRINRGPLLSKSPTKDFVNQTQGRLYGHKKIHGTDYYVLTHSQTSQKVEDLNRLCRVVGFALGSVQIEQVNRHSWLDGLN